MRIVNGWMLDFVKVIGWSVVAAVAMSLSLGLLLTVWDRMTPRIDEWEELKKGNMAVALVWASVILALGMVVAAIVHGGGAVAVVHPPSGP